MPLADYTGRLEQLVQRMQKTGARLIWASTTPTHRTVLTSSWFMTKSMKTRFTSSRLTKSPNVRSERRQRRESPNAYRGSFLTKKRGNIRRSASRRWRSFRSPDSLEDQHFGKKQGKGNSQRDLEDFVAGDNLGHAKGFSQCPPTRLLQEYSVWCRLLPWQQAPLPARGTKERIFRGSCLFAAKPDTPDRSE